MVDPKTKGIIESPDVVFLESGNIFDSNANYEFVEFPFQSSDEASSVDEDDDTASITSVATVIDRSSIDQQDTLSDAEPIDDSLNQNRTVNASNSLDERFTTENEDAYD